MIEKPRFEQRKAISKMGLHAKFLKIQVFASRNAPLTHVPYTEH